MSDRIKLEQAEARVLVDGYKYNNNSNEWLEKALKHTVKVYGRDADIRVKQYMREYWKSQQT
jgi:hypothetical protein